MERLIHYILCLFLEDDLALVRDIEIQNWAAELSDPESCQLQVNTPESFLLQW